MALKILILACLVIPRFLAAGDAPSPLSVLPLKFGENRGLYLPARINGSEFTCMIDSGGGDRIYLDKSKASAAGIQATAEGRSAGHP